MATTHQGLSIRNSLPGVVESLQPDADNRVGVGIRVADQLLFAQVTRHATDALALHKGMAAFALTKVSRWLRLRHRGLLGLTPIPVKSKGMR